MFCIGFIGSLIVLLVFHCALHGFYRSVGISMCIALFLSVCWYFTVYCLVLSRSWYLIVYYMGVIVLLIFNSVLHGFNRVVGI